MLQVFIALIPVHINSSVEFYRQDKLGQFAPNPMAIYCAGPSLDHGAVLPTCNASTGLVHCSRLKMTSLHHYSINPYGRAHHMGLRHTEVGKQVEHILESLSCVGIGTVVSSDAQINDVVCNCLQSSKINISLWRAPCLVLSPALCHLGCFQGTLSVCTGPGKLCHWYSP